LQRDCIRFGFEFERVRFEFVRVSFELVRVSLESERAVRVFSGRFVCLSICWFGRPEKLSHFLGMYKVEPPFRYSILVADKKKLK